MWVKDFKDFFQFERARKITNYKLKVDSAIFQHKSAHSQQSLHYFSYLSVLLYKKTFKNWEIGQKGGNLIWSEGNKFVRQSKENSKNAIPIRALP